jgi:hypothetical protein
VVSPDQALILLLLPYLAHRRNKNPFFKLLHRLRLRLGLPPGPERSFPHPALRQAARSITRRFAVDDHPSATTIVVKPHPKNQLDTGLICASLRRSLGRAHPVTVLPLSADVPLEQLVVSLPPTPTPGRLRLLGFGTNLLAARVFLFPSPVSISLVERQPSRTIRLLANAFESLLHRTEFLRRRHMSRLMASLEGGLEGLQTSQTSGAGPR